MELTIWRKAIANIGFIPLTTSGMWPRELARGSITTLRVAICFSVSALCYTHTGFHTDGFSLPRLDYCHCRSDSSLLSAILVMSAPLYTRTARSFTQTLSRYEASRQEAHPYNFYSRNPDAGWSSIDVQLRIYTLEQMKRQKNKHRFYLWDYLWWTGERLQDYHSRITGDDMLQMHFMFFVYFPILMLCAFAKPAFVNRSFFIYLLAFYFVLLLVWWIWNKQIYRASRRKAVMKHYADVNFNPGKGFLLFFMPLIFFIGVVITICSLME